MLWLTSQSHNHFHPCRHAFFSCSVCHFPFMSCLFLKHETAAVYKNQIIWGVVCIRNRDPVVCFLAKTGGVWSANLCGAEPEGTLARLGCEVEDDNRRWVTVRVTKTSYYLFTQRKSVAYSPLKQIADDKCLCRLFLCLMVKENYQKHVWVLSLNYHVKVICLISI